MRPSGSASTERIANIEPVSISAMAPKRRLHSLTTPNCEPNAKPSP
ncbi:hypothetical protein [Lysobacter gummosus]